jgi:hypothetical protein
VPTSFDMAILRGDHAKETCHETPVRLLIFLNTELAAS